jgi:HK97 family phage portal protein
VGIFASRLRKPQQRAVTIDGAIRSMGMSKTGMAVNHSSALTSTAVYAAIRLLADTVAQLPLPLYRVQANGGKKRATDHPLYRLLQLRANPEMSAFTFRQTLAGHQVGWGNGYAEIEWSSSGYPKALWPLMPSATYLSRLANGSLVYDTYIEGYGYFRLPAWRVLHVRGFGGDGLMGYSPIRLHAETIGLDLGTREHGATFFANGARPGVVLTHPELLDDEAVERMKASWNDAYAGLKNAHRVAILEEGVQIQQMGIPPNEAQFLETRRYQLQEIARIYRIPPHLLQDRQTGAQSMVEQLSREFVDYTLLPLLKSFEQEMTWSLLADDENDRFAIEHLVDGLLRGNTKDRHEAQAIGRQNGWLSVNDIRRMENLDPIEGGDAYLTPLNMVESGKQPTPTQGSGKVVDGKVDGRAIPEKTAQERRSEPEQVEKLRKRRSTLLEAHRLLYEDVAKRLVRREVQDLRRGVGKYLRKRSVQDFKAWLDEFYLELGAVMREQFAPTVRSLAEQMAQAAADELERESFTGGDALAEFIERYLKNLAESHIRISRAQLEQVIEQAQSDNSDVSEAIETRLNEWEERRPAKIAQSESYEGGNALAVFFYAAMGVRYLRWAARGDSCPFCRKLSGQVAGIDGQFVQHGDKIEGEEGKSLSISSKVRHGPLHGGCDCVVVAGG